MDHVTLITLISLALDHTFEGTHADGSFTISFAHSNASAAVSFIRFANDAKDFSPISLKIGTSSYWDGMKDVKLSTTKITFKKAA